MGSVHTMGVEMTRLRRFEEHRFVGARDTMTVYDTDDNAEGGVLAQRASDDRLLDLNLLQSFAPDTLAEARNRGFHPPRPTSV